MTDTSRFDRSAPRSATGLETETIAALRERLAALEEEKAARETQLQRYAQDLREIFQQERARTLELRRSYRATVLALSNAVEARDAYTGKHAERVAAYGVRIAGAAGVAVDAELEFGFLLHDVGKVAVPDAILFKPGALTDEERRTMMTHTEIGSAIVREIDFLGEARAVVRHHHERWDGDGYPDGLAGEDIPVAARVFAVADTLDALTTDRPYRRGCTWPQARQVIREGTGTQFDPRMVDAFDTIPDATFDRIRADIS